MRTVLVLSLIVAASLAAAAEPTTVHVGDAVDYSVPGSSPFRFVALGKYDVASFSGRATLEGTFHYGYITDDRSRDATYGELDLYFLPDQSVAHILPYWIQRGHVKELRFRNEQAFIRAVIPATLAKDVEQRHARAATGHTAIVVEEYQASIECDYPTYSVTFVEVAAPGPVQVAKALNEQYGC